MKKTVSFQLVTPAFSGQADSDLACPEGFSGRCLKPLLRYWWRTLHPAASSALRSAENSLFGSMGEEGQRFVVRPTRANVSSARKGFVPPDTVLFEEDPNVNTEQGFGPVVLYLAYGVMSREKDASNIYCTFNDVPMYHADTAFTFDLRYQDAYDREVEAALWLFSVFGGWGRRTRRGFGKIRVVQDWSHFPALEADTREDAVYILNRGLATAREMALESVSPAASLPSRPGHTAFCGGMRVMAAPQFYTTSVLALHALGEGFFLYRRFLGKNRDTREEGEDHDARADLAYEITAPAYVEPLRATHFGLPLNARFSSPTLRGRQVDENCSSGRRGSPLFLSVVKFGEAKYLPVIGYFPAEFLPRADDVTVHVHGGGRRAWTKTGVSNGDDTAVTEYLDSLIAGSHADIPAFPVETWTEL